MNGSWIAADTGFEVAIEGRRCRQPNRRDLRHPGRRRQRAARLPARAGPVPGEWNDLEIEVVGDTYTVRLNGQQTTRFTNPESGAGSRQADDPRFGYIGIQTYPFNPGQVDFRNIRIRELPAGGRAATPMP